MAPSAFALVHWVRVYLVGGPGPADNGPMVHTGHITHPKWFSVPFVGEHRKQSMIGVNFEAQLGAELRSALAEAVPQVATVETARFAHLSPAPRGRH